MVFFGSFQLLRGQRINLAHAASGASISAAKRETFGFMAV
jgi:hypothetical protein